MAPPTLLVSMQKLGQAGIWVVKPIGNGKFKVEEFTTNDIDTIFRVLQNNKIDGVENRDWKNVKAKIDNFVKEAARAALRLMGLPLEIREMVYDLLLVGNKTLYKRATSDPIRKGYPYAIRQVNKRFYADTKKSFYKNTFRLPEVRPDLGGRKNYGLDLHELQLNLTNVEFDWGHTTNRRDTEILKFLAGCFRLEKLTIEIHRNILYNGQLGLVNRITDGPVVDRLSRSANWDLLISLRGLKKIVVCAELGWSQYFFSDEELPTLVEHMGGFMCQPKGLPTPPKKSDTKKNK